MSRARIVGLKFLEVFCGELLSQLFRRASSPYTPSLSADRLDYALGVRITDLALNEDLCRGDLLAVISGIERITGCHHRTVQLHRGLSRCSSAGGAGHSRGNSTLLQGRLLEV